jgi:hypothetical protein
MKSEFSCIFPGNKIPNCFSHRKDVFNANSCEIDINEPVHSNSKNKIFVFSAVIGTEESQDMDCFQIMVEVINGIGQHMYSHRSDLICNSTGSDRVWLNFHGSCHSQLKTDNFRVKWGLDYSRYNPSKSSKPVFFKSCGFHVEHKYEEKTIDLIDDVQLSETL